MLRIDVDGIVQKMNDIFILVIRRTYASRNRL